jgi:dsRNA-specific ribonuclease
MKKTVVYDMDKMNVLIPGDRDSFYQMIGDIYHKRGGLDPLSVNRIFQSSDFTEIMNRAFTPKAYDPDNNLESLEFMGDTSANYCICTYFAKRFPRLLSPDGSGVRILSRLKIIYGAKKMYASFGEKLGFWNYIHKTHEINTKLRQQTLEDVFEAFMGASEFMINRATKHELGIVFIRNIIHSLLAEMNISLKYQDLFDSKTILKEVNDKIKNSQTRFVYHHVANQTINPITNLPETSSHTVHVYLVGDGVQRLFPHLQHFERGVLISTGERFKKIDAEQIAASKAIDFLLKTNEDDLRSLNIEPLHFPDYSHFTKKN